MEGENCCMVRQGDIFLTPFPFSDLSSTKKRPVLILSNSKYNGLTEDVIVAAITSKDMDREYSVCLSSNDLSEGQLLVDSYIRADKLFTISQGLLIKKFRAIKPYKMDEVREKLFCIFLP